MHTRAHVCTGALLPRTGVALSKRLSTDGCLVNGSTLFTRRPDLKKKKKKKKKDLKGDVWGRLLENVTLSFLVCKSVRFFFNFFKHFYLFLGDRA